MERAQGAELRCGGGGDDEVIPLFLPFFLSFYLSFVSGDEG